MTARPLHPLTVRAANIYYVPGTAAPGAISCAWTSTDACGSPSREAARGAKPTHFHIPAPRLDRASSRTTAATGTDYRGASRAARPRAARAARAPAGAGRGTRPDGRARQRAQSTFAMGLLRPQRPHLRELAAGAHAGLGAGLRAHSRAHASAAARSLREILAARGCSLSRLRRRTPTGSAPTASHSSPRHLTMTEVIRVDAQQPDSADIARAAACLRGGGLVAFPTETVYGLGAHALDRDAVLRLFEAKGRPANDPLIVHVASFDELPGLVTEIPMPRAPGARFWPGPLTLVMRRDSAVPLEVTAGLDTVAVRVPCSSGRARAPRDRRGFRLPRRAPTSSRGRAPRRRSRARRSRTAGSTSCSMADRRRSAWNPRCSISPATRWLCCGRAR